MPNNSTSLDAVRRHNLSRVLTLVHRAGAVSRSEITKQTGLNRSTVAGLVNELTDLRLVFQTEPTQNEADGKRGVGRPSPIVQPHRDCVAIAVNPEQDAITVGVVRLGGTVVSRVRHEVDSAPTVDEAVSIVTRIVRELIDALPESAMVAGIGVAVPGLVHASTGLVRLAPHLRWVDAPIAQLLTAATGLPTRAANDASLGATAEHLFGAGRSVSDLLYLNGGASGIGGGVIMGGAPLGGFGGYAGEFGHTLVVSAGEGNAARGDAPRALEDEVNRSALLRLTGLHSADDADLESALLSSGEQLPREGAIRDGAIRDEVVRQIGFLGSAVAGAINIFNPQRVVLGGFLATLNRLVPGLLDAQVRLLALPPSYEGVEIVSAELGANLLLIGAAELAFESILGDPALPFAGRPDLR